MALPMEKLVDFCKMYQFLQMVVNGFIEYTNSYIQYTDISKSK